MSVGCPFLWCLSFATAPQASHGPRVGRSFLACSRPLHPSRVSGVQLPRGMLGLVVGATRSAHGDAMQLARSVDADSLEADRHEPHGIAGAPNVGRPILVIAAGAGTLAPSQGGAHDCPASHRTIKVPRPIAREAPRAKVSLRACLEPSRSRLKVSVLHLWAGGSFQWRGVTWSILHRSDHSRARC